MNGDVTRRHLNRSFRAELREFVLSIYLFYNVVKSKV